MQFSGVQIMSRWRWPLVLASLVPLIACGPNAPRSKEISTFLNPPPQPPNCPETSELANIRLDDGRLADVRIIQFDETTLYVPAQWLGSDFVDAKRRSGQRIYEVDLPSIAPDLYRTECPGVIHEMVEQKEGANSKRLPFFTIWTEQAENLKSDEVHMLHFALYDQSPGPKMRVALAGGFYRGTIHPLPDVLVLLSTTKDYERRPVHSRSIDELAEWLATPPARRDNDRTFELEVDE
jgi:hypothetical protein